MSKHTLFFMALLFYVPLFSQSTIIDSLELLIPNATLKERAKIKYDTEPYLYSIVDIQERLQQAERYVEVSTKLKDSLLLDHAYWMLSRVQYALGDTLKSKETWDKGKTIAMHYGRPLGDSRQGGAGGVTYATTFTGIYKDSSRQMSFDSIQNRADIFEINNTHLDIDPNAVYWCKLKLRGKSNQTDNYSFQISSDPYGKDSWNSMDAFLVHEDGTVERQQ